MQHDRARYARRLGGAIALLTLFGCASGSGGETSFAKVCTAQGLTPGTDAFSTCVERQQLQQQMDQLIAAISSRVAKIHKEQSILHIQPVGKTFLLMDKTRFDVLTDDGEGQLSIRIYRDGGINDLGNEAGLAANDLLDGLYSGIIREV